MANYNYKVDDHPILGIIVGFVPIILYEMFRMRTNVWYENNGMTAMFIYGIAGIFMLLVCFYSGNKLRKGDRILNYQLPFYALMILAFIVADMKKVAHRRENSPVIFYATQSYEDGRFYSKAIDITFRENGTCRFTAEAGTFSEVYCETSYTRNAKEFNIEVPENMISKMPSTLILNNDMLSGKIHYNHQYKLTTFYFKTYKEKMHNASIFTRKTNEIN